MNHKHYGYNKQQKHKQKNKQKRLKTNEPRKTPTQKKPTTPNRIQHRYNTKNKLNLNNVEVLHSRIEDLEPEKLPTGYEIIARAVGSAEHLIRLTKKHLDNPGTQLKLMKTEQQTTKESIPENYTVKEIHKINSKGKDKGRILDTIEKNG